MALEFIDRFIDKVKSNVTHGGLMFKLQSPKTFSIQSPTIPIRVILTGTSSTQTVTGITAELRGIPLRDPNYKKKGLMTTYKIFGRVEYVSEFVINPNDVKSVELNLPNNILRVIQESEQTTAASSRIGAAFNELKQSMSMINPEYYDFSVQADATIANLKLKPEEILPIKLVSAPENEQPPAGSAV